MPLAASITEPPPIATSTSHPDSAYRWYPSVISVSFGFGVTPRQTVGVSPTSRRCPSSSCTHPASCTPSSVTTNGRRAPSRAAANPDSARAPTPKTISGAWNLTTE